MMEKDTSRWLQLQTIFMIQANNNKDSSRINQIVEPKDSTQIEELMVKRT
jgi:hypothetical protein